MEGLNTFGCNINYEEILLPQNGSGGIGTSPSRGLTAGYYLYDSLIYWRDSYLTITAKNPDNNYWSCQLYIKSFLGVGEYVLGEFNSDFTTPLNSFAEILHQDRSKTSFYSYRSSGVVSIVKFDTATNIVSGTFWFKAAGEDTADTIQVIDGRFDINLNSVNL